MTSFGPVTGDVRGNVQFKDGPVSFSQGAAGASIIMKRDTTIWYVDSGQSASGNGKTPKTAFITLQEAVTAAGDYDTILVMPNSIETIATGGISITQTGLKIFGGNGSEMRQAAALKIAAGTSPMFVIEADRVEIAGFNLSCRIAYPCISIGNVATGVGTAVYSTWIHHNNFDGYSTSTFAIAMGGAGGFGVAVQCDAVNLVVENNYFSSHATAAVVVSGTRMTVRNNEFNVPVDTIGVSVVETGGNRGFWRIHDNYFAGISNASTIGIKFAGNTTAGQGTVIKNQFTGTWDTSIDTNTGNIGCENYLGGSSSGALIDMNSS